MEKISIEDKIEAQLKKIDDKIESKYGGFAILITVVISLVVGFVAGAALS